MESTNFDAIINSSQNIVPKRLSFDFLNNTTSELHSGKKRKFYEMDYSASQHKKDAANESLNDSLNNSTSSICASWETKLLRSDLIEAQSRVCNTRKYGKECPLECIYF